MKAEDISRISETIIALERGINERWNKGDVDGALERDSQDVTYFDPLTETRLEGRKARRRTSASASRASSTSFATSSPTRR